MLNICASVSVVTWPYLTLLNSSPFSLLHLIGMQPYFRCFIAVQCFRFRCLADTMDVGDQVQTKMMESLETVQSKALDPTMRRAVVRSLASHDPPNILHLMHSRTPQS